MRPATLGVIGLGAIGGSLAWCAAKSGVSRIVGYSRLPADGVAAVKCGAVTELVTSARDVVRFADLLVLAAPPAQNLALLRSLDSEITRRDCLVTDVTGVKRPLVALASRLGMWERFAGSHPLAGSHSAGFAAASPGMFRGRIVYVTPVNETDGPAREIANFWHTVIGADPVIVDAEVHDHIVAWTSHLPQAVASALAHALAESGPRGVTFGAGARDTTRLAQSSTDMWRDILLLNRDEVLASLAALDDAVDGLRRALLKGDPAAVAEWLETGRRWRAPLGS